MPFVIKDDDVLDKYNETWNKIKQTLNIKFHSMPVYDKKYIKGNVREFNDAIKEKLSTGIFRRMQTQNEKEEDDQIRRS